VERYCTPSLQKWIISLITMKSKNSLLMWVFQFFSWL